MYISSTNFILTTPDIKVLPNWFTSERYYNCENINARHMQKRRKLFGHKKLVG